MVGHKSRREPQGVLAWPMPSSMGAAPGLQRPPREPRLPVRGGKGNAPDRGALDGRADNPGDLKPAAGHSATGGAMVTLYHRQG